MGGWNEFQGLNAGYVLELYDRYRQDPTAVDAETRAYFEQWTPPDQSPMAAPAGTATVDLRAVVGVATLAESIRRYGHLGAQIDPLGSRPTGDPMLAPEGHGITEEQLRQLPASVVSGPLAEGQPDAAAAIAALRQAYCSRTGYDFAQVFVPEEREWLRIAVETGRFRPPMAPIDAEALLDRITEVETFERFLHRTFPGKTRFSVEGLDMLVPILDTVIDGGNDAGLQHVLIGMAHRGRLNVLAHVLGKPYAQILAEFKDPVHGAQRLPHRPRLDRRREVPRRRAAPGGRRHAGVDGAQSEPSRVRQSGHRGHGARRGHRRRQAGQARVRCRPHAAGPHPRRLGLPRPGHRRRDAEPVAPGRLHHRRHDPHHRQQPARVHRRAGRVLLDLVRERPGARLQDPDRPRQRRRSRWRASRRRGWPGRTGRASSATS